MKRIIFASLLFFFCIIPNAQAFSGVIGVSPSEIHLQSEKGEAAQAAVNFQRSFPNADEVVLLEVDGENASEVEFAAGAKTTLPQGEQFSEIPFSINTENLEAGVHEFVVRITGEKPVIMNGNGLLMGVGVRVLVTVTEPLTQEQIDQNAAKEEDVAVAYNSFIGDPPEISILEISSPTLEGGEYSGVFTVRNETQKRIYGVPFILTAENKNKEFLVNAHSTIPQSLNPQEETEVAYSFFSEDAGIFSLRVSIGNSLLEDEFTFGFLGIHSEVWVRWIGYIAGLCVVLLLAAFMLSKMKRTVRVRTVVAVFSSILLCAVGLYLVRANTGFFQDVEIGSMYGVSGEVLLTQLSDSAAFTQLDNGAGKKVDKYDKVFVQNPSTIAVISSFQSEEDTPLAMATLLQNSGATKAYLGEYDSVETFGLNNRNTHALVKIKRQSEAESEYCLINTFLAHEGCVSFLDESKDPLEYAEFSQSDGRYIMLVIDGKNMIHDLWFDSSEDFEEEILQSSFASAALVETKKIRFLSQESGKHYLVPFGAQVAELSGGGYLFFIDEDGGQNVYLATADGRKSQIASFSSIPQDHYLFSSGTSMTSP